MYDLKQIGAKTYYIDCPAKVGIYLLDEKNVCLIDSGSDVHAARKVNQHIKEQGWNVRFIICTHSHADHIGGNHYFQKRYGCDIYAKGQELPFVRWPVMEPTFLFGGAPIPELRNKFLEAQPSEVKPLEAFELPSGLEVFDLSGHAPDMVGVQTSDDVAFMADCVAGDATLQKYHLTYLHDVEGFLNTLDRVEQMDCDFYVPSHTEVVTDIKPLAALNRSKVEEIIENILEFSEEPKTFEAVLQAVFEHYNLRMDIVQYSLIGTTTRAYLSYLHQKERLVLDIHHNQLFWKRVSV